MTGSTPDRLSAGSTPDPLRPPLRPLALLRSAAPWRATAYLASYLVLGPVLFAFCLATVVVCFVLNITMLGLPLLIGAAALLRGGAHIERARLRLVSRPVEAAYRTVEPMGIRAAVKARWTDPATLRDLSYLICLFVPLLVLDAVALVIWVTSLALVVVPTWYWAVPDGGALGVLQVDSLPAAFAAALVGCALLLVTCYVVTGAARLHAATARKLLGPRTDPLSAAKRLLAEPGPLSAATGSANPSAPSVPSASPTGMNA
ncbi:hypothetical protein ADK55_27740 [Streptomyces sp. WM4235]|uniref:sensor domain-containing protein n=1 Tax=Streptomyces sp. WM4235 TaxID=1415551 RepID=UPI0006AE33C9|nr:sensor domain-containing protein [Streptomyces sp. WM4235]KOU41703.1 hypothetical protein ADK55_27740 [Streptomyces sp. WM4235]